MRERSTDRSPRMRHTNAIRALCSLRRITLHTYCEASNLGGMFIFTPVPSLAPTSWNNNGCQVEFGLDRIKLSPPLLCVNLLPPTFSYLIHFHSLHRRGTKFSVAARPGGPGALLPGTVKWLSSQRGTGRPSRAQLCARALGIGRRPAHASPGNMLGVTGRSERGLLVNKKGNCDAVRDQC